MLYAIISRDRDGVEELRARTKAEHLAYLARHEEILLLGGVTLSDDAGLKDGSIWIVNVPDRAAADRFVENEPFVRAGIFREVRITRMNNGQFNPAAIEGAERI